MGSPIWALAKGEKQWFGKEEEALFGKSNEAFELRNATFNYSRLHHLHNWR
jgi:hypothetical protein